MAEKSVEEIADAMYDMIKAAMGLKKYKAIDLQKAMMERFGTDKKDCKLAIRALVDNGRCVYTYFGGSYIEIPHEEGAANK
jgi:hypothetical protein